MDGGPREQGRVHRVVRVMMAEHHVGDLVRARPAGGQRAEQALPAGHQAGVDHDHAPGIEDQGDRAAHPVPGFLLPHVSLVQNENPRGACPRAAWPGHRATAGRAAFAAALRCCL